MTGGDGGAAFPIRLVAAPSRGEPDGLVLALPQAIALLGRLRPRASSYPALRLALAGELAVLFAAEKAPLPWVEAPVAWLEAEGALYLPSGFGLDAPMRWRAEVVSRLLQHHGLGGPAALLPASDPAGQPRLVDLSASRALTEVDHDRLASFAR